MKFGKVAHPETVDFSFPQDHPDTQQVLSKHTPNKGINVSVGCAKWNRKELKNFYPRGTKDELQYYATQFNSIELNATFYRMFPAEQFQKWHDKVGDDFRFFPKVPRLISHTKRLVDAQELVTDFTANLLPLNQKLGMVFLQMPENFSPKNMDRLPAFFEAWPREIPLACEMRHTDWYNDAQIANELHAILTQHNITNIITDSAGRRDLLHMRLSTPTAFIRYNGANHESDYTRLDDWGNRLETWYEQGLQNLYFFVHQNIEEASPLLSAYFIEQLNKRLPIQLMPPNRATLDL